jgi:hypothetical protein
MKQGDMSFYSEDSTASSSRDYSKDGSRCYDGIRNQSKELRINNNNKGIEYNDTYKQNLCAMEYKNITSESPIIDSTDHNSSDSKDDRSYINLEEQYRRHVDPIVEFIINQNDLTEEQVNQILKPAQCIWIKIRNYTKLESTDDKTYNDIIKDIEALMICRENSSNPSQPCLDSSKSFTSLPQSGIEFSEFQINNAKGKEIPLESVSASGSHGKESWLPNMKYSMTNVKELVQIPWRQYLPAGLPSNLPLDKLITNRWLSGGKDNKWRDQYGRELDELRIKRWQERKEKSKQI